MNSPFNGDFKVTQEYKGESHKGMDLVGLDSKEVHSTVSGIVSKAGWQNPENHSEGYGQRVYVEKDGTNDHYIFAHLSSIKVKVGQKVSVGTVIGIEGSTGSSTGSHLHYEVRENADKNKYKDVSAISGIPNKIGTYNDGSVPSSSSKTIPTPTLKEGSQGQEVKELQSILGGLDVDGIFGSKTESKLKEWQKKYMGSSEADGIYGSKTEAKMKEVY